MSVMTAEGYNQWVQDPTTPDKILRAALHEGYLTDLPAPQRYIDALHELLALEQPSEAQIEATLQVGVDEFRRLRGEAD